MEVNKLIVVNDIDGQTDEVQLVYYNRLEEHERRQKYIDATILLIRLSDCCMNYYH